jgi:NADH-quinone oxidoreductase subunit N
MTNEFVYALGPDLLLLGAIVALMLLEMLRVDARWARLGFIAAATAGVAVLVQQFTAGLTADVVPGELGTDRFAQFGKLVLLLCGLGVAIGFAAARGYKFWLLVASSTLGGMLMLGAIGFAPLFIGIELLSLPAFALIVQGQGRSAAAEGAFKYLVLSSVASGLLLFGVSLAYGLTGSLSIAAWAHAFEHAGLQGQAGGLLVLSGLFLKAAVFPFHAWAPDAYAAARLPVTALMASLVKAAVILALARIVAAMPLGPATAFTVSVLAIVSIVFGNLAALGQARFRRLLAYSSVAHAGYMIFALLDTTGSRGSDLLWYAAFYGLATVLACASFAALCPDGDDDLGALDGKFRTQPVAATLLALAMLSLAGLPPLPGFFAKLFVFRSVIASGHVVPAVLAFIGSFLGLAYYAGIAMRLFQPASSPRAAGAERTRTQADEHERATA